MAQTISQPLHVAREIPTAAGGVYYFGMHASGEHKFTMIFMDFVVAHIMAELHPDIPWQLTTTGCFVNVILEIV
jgi:hypothetical protein